MHLNCLFARQALSRSQLFLVIDLTRRISYTTVLSILLLPICAFRFHRLDTYLIRNSANQQSDRGTNQSVSQRPFGIRKCRLLPTSSVIQSMLRAVPTASSQGGGVTMRRCTPIGATRLKQRSKLRDGCGRRMALTSVIP